MVVARRQGPPTSLNWTLLLLGYSALFSEDKERADRCFAEGVEIDLPPRTHTPSEPLKARAAFQRGEHLRAFTILRDHIDELLVTDNMQAGMMDCIEFVTMMAAAARTEEAAAVLRHLEAGHLLDTPGWRLLVTEPAAALHGHGALGGITDDRAPWSSCAACSTASSKADPQPCAVDGTRTSALQGAHRDRVRRRSRGTTPAGHPGGAREVARAVRWLSRRAAHEESEGHGHRLG